MRLGQLESLMSFCNSFPTTRKEFKVNKFQSQQKRKQNNDRNLLKVKNKESNITLLINDAVNVILVGASLSGTNFLLGFSMFYIIIISKKFELQTE